MKSLFRKSILLVIIALGLSAFAEMASAYYYRCHNCDYRRGGNYYHEGYVYRPVVRYGANCKWVGGFWRNGYWHAARRVCWR